eukprot:Phypoly_transcript_05793.p1 GENE.Phypoly_transcript_05793~~Phypoly_transcript_05793.p1  ORF type:complete len:409 (+),score=66.25 Phypoly_transcript_05793:512-1738(+)
MWAPHIVLYNDLYYMFYCGGGASDEQYQINLRTSPDMWTWTFNGTLFTDGWDARDPMVVNLGPKFNNLWVMYYCATSPNSGDNSVHHVTYARKSTDLLNWSPSVLVFDAGPIGTPYGGPTESPFVVRRGASFYLFSGSWDSYSDTRVFVSSDPFNFGSTLNGTAQQVGEIAAHAPEVVRDVNGDWYISRAGWGQGGVFLSPLLWQDGLDSEETSLPPPSLSPLIPSNFNTSIPGWTLNEGEWVETPTGLQGGYVYGDAFYVSSEQATNFTYEADVLLITKDGNPNSPPDQWTRDGSAAALVFRCAAPCSPDSESYVLNIHTDLGGGVKLFKFPYQEIQQYSYNIQQNVIYHIKVEVSGPSFVVWFAPPGHAPAIIFKAVDTSYSSGYLGLDVWQGSAIFQNIGLSYSA